MPITSDDFFISSPNSPRVALEPVINALSSLILLHKQEWYPGLEGWVTETRAAMSAAEHHTTKLVMEGLYHALPPHQNYATFDAYIAGLEAQEPTFLRDQILDAYAEMPCQDQAFAEPARDTILGSVDAYISYLSARFAPDRFDVSLEREAHLFLKDPVSLQQLVVSYMRKMWTHYLEPEWERVQGMLNSSVAAFQSIELTAMEKSAAAEFVTGQTMDGKWLKWIERAEAVTFVPSAHVGPYLMKFVTMINGREQLYILFGARVPDGVLTDSPELGRAELLNRLNALADDTRLRVLKLLAEEGELCAPDIMTRLELSQSATSRHMRQLSANGFVSERRREGAKCYRLNRDRIEMMMHAFGGYLGLNS